MTNMFVLTKVNNKSYDDDDKCIEKSFENCVLLCIVRETREKAMRGLNQLGAVETIYEEECEFSSTSSPSPSPSFSSTPASLHSRVKAW